MKNFIILALLTLSISAQATMVKDPANILNQVDQIYKKSNSSHLSMMCDDYSASSKFFHELSMECNQGEFCDLTVDLYRMPYNLTHYGCGTGTPYIVSTLGQNHSLENLESEKNMVQFYIKEMLGEEFPVEGEITLLSMSETTFSYYSGLPFEKKVKAYILKAYYKPYLQEEGKLNLNIVFDPTQTLLKQILEVQLGQKGESWFRLHFN